LSEKAGIAKILFIQTHFIDVVEGCGLLRLVNMIDDAEQYLAN
jgi:hypothetical protein